MLRINFAIIQRTVNHTLYSVTFLFQKPMGSFYTVSPLKKDNSNSGIKSPITLKLLFGKKDLASRLVLPVAHTSNLIYFPSNF